VIEDGTRVGVAYFLMSEDNIRREVALPWMSFASDEAAPAPEGVFLLSNPHLAPTGISRAFWASMCVRTTI